MTKQEKQKVVRFSVSLPEQLANSFDEIVAAQQYPNRSAAVADLIRERLVEHRRRNENIQLAGTITLIYDHHKPHLQQTLTALQHDHHDAIISTTHVHLDHHNCLEVLIVHGRAGRIRQMAEALINAKGVRHGRLTIAATQKDLD